MPGTLNIQLCPMISSAMYKHVLYANWTSVRRPINPSREDMRDLRMWLYDNGFPDEPCLSPFLLQPTPRWLNSSHLVQSLVPGIEFVGTTTHHYALPTPCYAPLRPSTPLYAPLRPSTPLTTSFPRGRIPSVGYS